MFTNRWFWFGAGVVVGVVAARYFLGQPEGRRVAKSVLKGGFALRDWATTQYETLHEEVTDLFAEAEHEYAAKSEGAASGAGA